MDTSKLTPYELNFIYSNGNSWLKSIATAELSARQISQVVAQQVKSNKDSKMMAEEQWEQKALKAGWIKPDPTRILGDE